MGPRHFFWFILPQWASLLLALFYVPIDGEGNISWASPLWLERQRRYEAPQWGNSWVVVGVSAAAVVAVLIIISCDRHRGKGDRPANYPTTPGLYCAPLLQPPYYYAPQDSGSETGRHIRPILTDTPKTTTTQKKQVKRSLRRNKLLSNTGGKRAQCLWARSGWFQVHPTWH